MIVLESVVLVLVLVLVSTYPYLHLYQDLQKEVIDSNGKIITEFGQVAEQLRRIGTTIDKLNKSYQDMRSHVTVQIKWKADGTIERYKGRVGFWVLKT